MKRILHLNYEEFSAIKRALVHYSKETKDKPATDLLSRFENDSYWLGKKKSEL